MRFAEDDMDESIAEAWKELLASLEARKRELADDVRSYPTPIARCDDQLPGAIAQRDEAARLLGAALEIEGSRSAAADARWRERARDFAARLDAAGDAALSAARSRVLAWLDAR
jgi:hypothetical protein